MIWEVGRSETMPDCFSAEAVGEDGELCCILFLGPGSLEQALEYAAWKNGKSQEAPMSHDQFLAELYIASYKAQIDGYPFGHPRRQDFHPIVAACGSRSATLALPCYAGLFTPEQRAMMLEDDASA